MTRFFLAIYRYFKSHKAVYYTILISTTLVFAFFGLRIKLVENIVDLLPKTERSQECEVAFSNIKVKDKIFVEVLSKDSSASVEETAAAMDSFLAILFENDTDSLVGNCLYKLDVDDIMNLVYYGMDALPCHFSEKIEEAFEQALSEEGLAAIKEGRIPLELPIQSEFKIIDGHMFSPDSTLALAFIAPGFDGLDTQKGGRFESMMVNSIKEFQKDHPGFEVLFHGTPVKGMYNSRQIKKDIYGSISISLIIICIFICISFRGKRTLPLLLMPVVYGTFFSLACVYWIKGTMSLIALGIGAIVLGVAISYCLHVLTHHKFVKDVEQVIREQAKPVCLGCITTIGAFAGLLFTTSELLRDFGIFASLALIGTTFFALAFLPQFFTENEAPKNEKIFGAIEKFNSLQPDKNKFFVGALVIVAIVCIYFSKDVKFDSDLNHIGYLEPKAVLSEETYNKCINGAGQNMYYAAHSSSLDSAIIFSRAIYPKLDSLQKVGIIESYSGTEGILIPEDEQLENIARWKAFWTPKRKAEAVAALRKAADENNWFEKTGFEIPEAFKAMTEADYSPVSLYEYGAIPDALMCNFVEQNDDGWLVFTNVRMNNLVHTEISDEITAEEGMIVLSPFYYTGDMVEIAHSDFNIVLLISSIFVFLVLILSFRSLTISIIAFMPMMLSWYILQGVMAIFGIEFNLINIMISTFVFGIGVDYSIFVMEGLLAGCKNGDNSLLINHKAAIFFSGVTLIVVIGSLLFATHPAIYSTGITTIIGMVSTILITYTLQPLLFRLAMKSPFLRKIALHEK